MKVLQTNVCKFLVMDFVFKSVYFKVLASKINITCKKRSTACEASKISFHKNDGL